MIFGPLCTSQTQDTYIRTFFGIFSDFSQLINITSNVNVKSDAAPDIFDSSMAASFHNLGTDVIVNIFELLWPEEIMLLV